MRLPAPQRAQAGAYADVPQRLQGLEQPRLVVDEYAFEREHALLGVRAARRRETTDPAAGRQHAMAWDDQRDGVLPHRLADRLCAAFRADVRRKLAIGQCPAPADRAQHVVKLAAER